MSWFSSFFTKKDRAARYENEKQIVLDSDVSHRSKLAKDPSTSQEILYYLAQNDKDAGVRKSVASNKSTPFQASDILATDRDQDVRLALAERLIRLLPTLSNEKHSQLYAYSIQALGTLALDEVLKIRVALSSALKDELSAPPHLVATLARDLERQVSEPILRFCVSLADEDLLNILRNHPESWAVQAIAGRSAVSDDVSLAVIETEDMDAGLILLENEGASIRNETLGLIVERSKVFPKLQKAIAIRKNLPSDVAKALAGFVDESVRTLLMDRTDFDVKTMDEIGAVIRRRLDFIDKAEQDGETPEARVKALIEQNKLNEEVIMDAIGVRDRDFVIVALAAMVHGSRVDIEKMFALRTPKPVVAVSWKAGLSMRTAFILQKEIAFIQPKELIYPRGGTDYPLDIKELEWQLEFLGLKK